MYIWRQASHYQSIKKKKNANNTFDCIKIGIDINRDELYERINKRVDSMVEQGLEQEVKSLIDFKYLQALQTVGYKEWFDYFNKKTSLEKTIDLIKQNTRNYAKRQVTWFKKEPDLVWLTPSKVDSFFHL
jgi:tRNA dimethylallyltransferase